MAIISLFGQEAQAIVKSIESEITASVTGVYDNYMKTQKECAKAVKPKREPVKREPKVKSYTEYKWDYKKFCEKIKELEATFNPARKFVAKPNEVLVVDSNFIMREDLRDIIFKEDETGRFRERVWDEIKKFGVENWFKAKGFPTNPDSIWKNRYAGTEIRLDQEVSNVKWRTLEEQGYLLWENYMPKEIWGAEDSHELSDLKRKAGEYKVIIDEGRQKFLPLLNKWKDFIVNLCNEKGAEIEKIWFDESCPYDCEVSVRLTGHRCWNDCVSFRFQNNILKAFDSGFGGGTTMLWLSHTDYLENPNLEQDKVKEVMEKVINKECDTYSVKWNKEEENKVIEHRIINIDSNGWEI